MATLAGSRVGVLSFWQKMALGISAFIVFGFAQFAARGFIDYKQAPVVMHLHGLIMVTWLGLVCTQAMLVGRGNVVLHRRLGWASAVMIPLIVLLASLTCITALKAGTFPPFFTAAYFLATVHVGVLFFALLVALAVARRRQPEWHRRLMIGATILIMEPALGRVLPMPVITPWGEWLAMVVQLGVAMLIVRHDKRVLRRVHPATVAVLLLIVVNHVLVELLARTPAWQGLAAQIAAG